MELIEWQSRHMQRQSWHTLGREFLAMTLLAPQPKFVSYQYLFLKNKIFVNKLNEENVFRFKRDEKSVTAKKIKVKFT